MNGEDYGKYKEYQDAISDKKIMNNDDLCNVVQNGFALIALEVSKLTKAVEESNQNTDSISYELYQIRQKFIEKERKERENDY
ncbi:hypothetical protein [Methanococcus voltae]|uniref:Uncharacterized protein n=1 Tax=Methanococcus voltae (strain ATCC BAA-1334 / A3) TaxID=456320 RepID=D7DSQ6_METV3|nr:hypothetical protein [Methanococcus voltae]MCS3901767.1 hypothetical protein [Methanococcus voltae]